MTETDNYLGLTRPLHMTCNICYNHYNAVIHMETYHHDSRFLLFYLILIFGVYTFIVRIILKETGLNKIVPVSHMNEHGSHTIKILDIKNTFQK